MTIEYHPVVSARASDYRGAALVGTHSAVIGWTLYAVLAGLLAYVWSKVRGCAMDGATGSLGQGETGRAYGQQGEAMEAMREGLEGMMQQMFGQQGQQTAGRGPNRDQRDPLGRPQRTQGPDLGNNVQVPDEIDVQRVRRILNAIRQRLGERFRPRFELDYLERLLQPE